MFGFFGPKTFKTAKFFIQLNVFPMSLTAPFLAQKALETANSEKFVFSCQTAASVAPTSSCHSSSWCDRGRCREGWHRRSAGAPGRAERVDRPAHPGAARSRLSAGAADAALLSASGRCCVKEPHFPEKLLRSRTYEQAARRPARPL